VVLILPFSVFFSGCTYVMNDTTGHIDVPMYALIGAVAASLLLCIAAAEPFH